jgi:Leucine-rich repeat (LRR) protein
MLREIYLDGNSMSIVEPGAFNGLSKLQRLCMDRNKIEAIEPDTFKRLPYLTAIFCGIIKLPFWTKIFGLMQVLTLKKNIITTWIESSF